MSEVLLISAQADIISEVASRLVADGKDLSRNIVVFPGKRPAHALRRALSKTTGTGFLPPQIYSIDNFVDAVWKDKLARSEKTLEALDAAVLLHEIHVNDARRIGGNNFTSLDSFLPLGMKIFGELEEVWIADIPISKVREALTGIEYSGVTSLLVFYEQFYALAAERGFASRSTKYRAVAEKIGTLDFAECSKIVFAGFFALTTSERAILQHMSRLDAVVQIFQNGPGIAGRLKELGVSPELPAHPSHAPSFHFYQSADAHGEAFALTKKIDEARRGNGFSPERTAIVLPAPENLFPVFHQTLALIPDDDYNISLGYPVIRTPVYGFLETLLQLRGSKYEDRYASSEYINFVLHPYTKNIQYEKRSDISRILFNTIEEFFVKEHRADFFSLDELEDNAPLFERAAKRVAALGEGISAQSLKEHLASIHAHTLRAYDTVENIGAFAASTVDLLTYINTHSTAQLHPFFHPFAEAVVEFLESLSTSLLAGRHFDEFTEYSSFLRNAIRAADVPFTGTPLHGLQVLGFLETRNLQFDTVFILDANDDVLPGNKGQDVLLPVRLRESLGLSTFRERERMAEYYFSCLIQGAKEVHLFFVQDGKREKSRYVEKLLWEKEQKEKQIQPTESIQTLRYKIALANTTPAAVPKTEAIAASLKDFVFSATALDMYLKCPLKFYYSYVLRLHEREEVSGELESSDVGVIVHRALAEYFRPLKNKLLESKDLSVAALEHAIDVLFTTMYGGSIFGPVYLLKKQVTAHLESFLTAYQLPSLAKKIELIELELPLESPIGPYQFKGKLDRVERRGGNVYILDYKTGGSEKYSHINFKKLVLDDRDTWSDAIGSLQLPLYAMLYATASGIPVQEIVPAYLFLGRHDIDETIEAPLVDGSASSAESFAVAGKIIERLAGEIADVERPFAPTKHFERECRACAFKYMCGTQWAVNSKQ
ncbi:MAG TPA: PD-(D/E)XK nuclease family protein [Bacteroidota bacterium]|nr:PD-(D/E)XK nuclease family protein [Bacteroidota bacterium]